MFMTEKLLQYIWQCQYFNSNELKTITGERLTIIDPGVLNRDQGPDFSQARIKIDKTLLAGSIELHLRTSDWKKHKHDNDRNYRNVILHVVWVNDSNDIESLPILSLQERVPNFLLNRYNEWMDRQGFIPCESSIGDTNPLTWNLWKEKLLEERMQHKSMRIHEILKRNQYHWEETLWCMLARNFGMKINADSFEAIAVSLPLGIVLKQKSQLIQLEALLLGQAGLLNKSFEESYPILLQAEYRHLQKKYSLRPILQPLFFLRMRPINFPTIRLAQLAALLHHSTNLFRVITEIDNLPDMEGLLCVQANDYWHYHYVLDESSTYQPKQLGKQMVKSIIINTIAPWLFAYGDALNEQKFKDRAFQWLKETGFETNSVVTSFQQLGLQVESAQDSQAILHLKSHFCDKRNCLDCSIGQTLLQSAKVS